MKAVGCSDQLGRNPQTVTGAPHRTFDDMLHSEGGSDFLHWNVLTFEVE